MTRRHSWFQPLTVALALLCASPLVAQQSGAEIEAFGLRLGGDTDESVLLRIRIEPTGRLVPLLPYLFFDHASADLPDRYLSASGTVTSDRFVRAYRGMLPLLAARMAQYPNDTLVVTGTRAGDETRDGRLARRRAEAVATALVNSGADRNRIAIRATTSPRAPSSERHEQGRAENRRVELSGSPRLLAPIAVADSGMEVESPGLRLVPDVTRTVSDTAGWRIELRHAGKLFRRLSGRGPAPEAIDESFTETERRWLAESASDVIEVRFAVFEGGDSILARTRNIPLRRETQRRQARPAEGRPQDRETIVIFGFDSDQPLLGADAVLEDLVRRIGPSARVSVVGFTDETGDPEHNLELSQRRAATIAERLGTWAGATRGAGESGGLHWNTTPEDRFYSRAVRMTLD